MMYRITHTLVGNGLADTIHQTKTRVIFVEVYSIEPVQRPIEILMPTLHHPRLEPPPTSRFLLPHP